VPTATETARAALLRLTQLGLPPTPENFQRFFAEASGADPARPMPAHGRPVMGTQAEGTAEAREMIQAVRRFAEQLFEATGTLADGIGQKNEELRVSMGSVDSLASMLDDPEVSTLLNTVLSITSSMHATVDASHSELVRTREAIDQLRGEMQQSREWMQQDPLTGMQNRRGMEIALGRELARARRSGSALSVAMLDIDHFKKLNDTYGHPAGDCALVHLCDIAKSILRESDIMVRYGGDDFLLVLPETDRNGTLLVIDRLKVVVQKTPLIYEGSRIALSFSAGVAQLQAGENPAALVLRADRAMLQAKSAGRDTIRQAEA
jgi:diguanylate cyclase